MIQFIILSYIIRHKSVNSCLLPACAIEGKHVVTIEGIGNVDNLHPVQEKIATHHGRLVTKQSF